MSEISARPWNIRENQEDEDGRMVSYPHVFDADGNIVEPYIDLHDEKKWEHIVKCVNEHDALVAEVERLKQYIEGAKIAHELSAEERESTTEMLDGKIRKLKEEVKSLMSFQEMQKNSIDALKRENDDYYYKVVGIMHSVDKWLDNVDEDARNEVERAAQAREIALQTIEKQEVRAEKAEAEVERLKQENFKQFKALEYLVKLKRHKDKYGKTSYYADNRQRAWDEAMSIIKDGDKNE